VDVAGDYDIRFMVQSLWGSSGSSSTVDILGAGVLLVTEGHCANIE